MSLDRPTILVVDDELSVTDLLHEDMLEEGYACLTAASGEDALESMRANEADLVLLDLRLPDISGMEVLRNIQSTHPGTGVIVISALGDAQTAVQALKLGALDYITKPFEIEKVNESIETALQARTVLASESSAEGEVVEAAARKADWMRYLDDIADGVQTRLDSLTSHVMNIAVIEQTVDIARNLEIPEEQIEKWMDARKKHIKRVHALDALLTARTNV